MCSQLLLVGESIKDNVDKEADLNRIDICNRSSWRCNISVVDWHHRQPCGSKGLAAYYCWADCDYGHHVGPRP